MQEKARNLEAQETLRQRRVNTKARHIMRRLELTKVRNVYPPQRV